MNNPARRGSALVESTPFDRRVAGSNPAPAATYREGLWENPSLTVVACVALRRVNSDTYERLVP